MNLPRIEIRGWRNISHSYAMVNQFQLLAINRGGLAETSHVDMPYVVPQWGSIPNAAGLTESDVALINGIPSDRPAENVYNIYAPGELVARDSTRTLTFLVTEFGFSNGQFPERQIKEYRDAGGLVHTPSFWSRDRLIDAGFTPDMIRVIPHAADPAYFYPFEPERIEFTRSNLGFSADDVVLLNVGSHYWNKGLDLVVKAFAAARIVNKRLRLVLKDQSAIYLMSSRKLVLDCLQQVGVSNSDIMDSIRIIDGNLTLAQLNELYNLADAYVTPYRAEGFNMPAFEAQVCGTPVLATRGGATDDFLDRKSSYFVDGERVRDKSMKPDLTRANYIEPDLGDLTLTFLKLGRKKLRTEPVTNTGWQDVAREVVGLFL